MWSGVLEETLWGSGLCCWVRLGGVRCGGGRGWGLWSGVGRRKVLFARIHQTLDWSLLDQPAKVS